MVPCTVCEQGCARSSVQVAIDNAAPGAMIGIAPGTYIEDLAVTQSVTLARCAARGDVLLKNFTPGGRTIELPQTQPSTSNNLPTLTLEDVIVTSGRNVGADEDGGGIAGFGNLVMNGAATITGNTVSGGSGGGVRAFSNLCTVEAPSGSISGNTPNQCVGTSSADCVA